MLATRDDVVECYRRLLGREPEGEAEINHHLSNGFDVWSLIQSFLNSEERKLKEDESAAFSIMKCYRGDYLAKVITKADRTKVFIDNMYFVRRLLNEIFFEEIMYREICLFRKDLHEVIIQFSRKIFIEGELSLIARSADRNLYILSFTFVRGLHVCSSDKWVVLISRMQGYSGTYDAIRQFTKCFEEITPQALLFTVLSGIAHRSGLSSIVGASAGNLVCSNERIAPILKRHYDEFYQSIGPTQCDSNYFSFKLPITHKSLDLITAMHRRRSISKRNLKAKIAVSAGDRWAEHFSNELSHPFRTAD